MLLTLDMDFKDFGTGMLMSVREKIASPAENPQKQITNKCIKK